MLFRRNTVFPLRTAFTFTQRVGVSMAFMYILVWFETQQVSRPSICVVCLFGWTVCSILSPRELCTVCCAVCACIHALLCIYSTYSASLPSDSLHKPLNIYVFFANKPCAVMLWTLPFYSLHSVGSRVTPCDNTGKQVNNVYKRPQQWVGCGEWV